MHPRLSFPGAPLHLLVRMVFRSTPASQETPRSSAKPPRIRGSLLLVASLALVLAWLFRDSFDATMALFANDGPLGAVTSRTNAFPDAWTGIWSDLNWLGFDSGTPPTSLTYLVLTVLGPRGYINFGPAVASIFLGLGAYAFGRTAGFRAGPAAVMATGAALNSGFFSYACWGLSTLPTCIGSIFFAMAALRWEKAPMWLRCTLSGAALGHALMEGFDNGAILSLYVAAFAVALAWFRPGTPVKRLSRGFLVTAGIAATSAIVAVNILLTLIQFNITGAAGMGQDKESKAARWGFATQWSLPPSETLRAIIPGMYGYRMDSPDGRQYWGKVGMDPALDAYWSSPTRNPESRPPALLRYSGSGLYTGVPVVLFAMFGVYQGFRRKSSVVSAEDRRWIWFWTGSALLSLLLAWGRFAPFYQFIFALPYFSTIRNPIKFLHPLNISLVVLCGYGLQAWWSTWSEKPQVREPGLAESLAAAWNSKAEPERHWTRIMLAACGAALLGWLLYSSAPGGHALLRHLAEAGFDPKEASAIARVSRSEVGLFVLVLWASSLLLALGVGRWFAGSRAYLAVVAVGGLVALDLARANTPWIIHYKWRERYATNPLFDMLRQAPHEGRVTGQLPFGLSGAAGNALGTLGRVFGGEWNQHQFRFYDIQSLEVVQLSRPPADYDAWQTAVRPHPVRAWELSNTRFLLGLAGLAEPLNDSLDKQQRRFRQHTAFNLSQDADGVILVETNATGPFALIEFTGALPRAMLYDRWQKDVPDDQALTMLGSTNFNPHAEVLVADAIPAPSVDTTSQPAGTVRYQNYAPKHFTLETDARTPCVLLVNDHYSPNWKVRVDGREEPLLRANYLVRGVYLQPGKHVVAFSFEPPLGSMLCSAGSLILALGITVVVGVRNRTAQTPKLPDAR